MNLRIRFSNFLLNFGDFIQTLPIVILRPNDIIQFNLETYSKQRNIDSFSNDSFVNEGLHQSEMDLLTHLPQKRGNMLILGVGGGREVIPLADMGFSVTGVDFISELVENTVHRAQKRGISLVGLVQDISKLDVSRESFEVAWLTVRMYSSIPTQERRIEMLKRIHQALKPGGYFLCQFYWDPHFHRSRIGDILRRIVAVFTLGNLGYQQGDILWRNAEFIHIFSTIESLSKEIVKGGFTVQSITVTDTEITGSCVCRK